MLVDVRGGRNVRVRAVPGGTERWRTLPSPGMDWTEQIDLYCERTGPGLWAEPLNLLSNGGFLIAAALAWVRYRRRGQRDRGLELQIALVALIGVGSGLFHSVATRWAQVADVAPITALVLVYLAYFVRRVMGRGWRDVAVVIGGFLAISALLSLIPRAWVNGSQSYFGVVVAMVALAAASPAPVAARLRVAAAVFAGSLVMRSIDQEVCGSVPIGVHFLWHSGNGLLVYLMMRTAIDATAEPA